MATVDDLAAVLAERLPGRVRLDVPAGELTTYRLGGPLRLVVDAASTEDVLAVAAALVEHGPGPEVLVIGRGSNLLVADAGFGGLTLVLGGRLDEVVIDEGRVVAGGGVALPVLARRAAAVGRAGLEFYVGIPGTVGGAVRMNAGGHGRETGEVLVAADVVDLVAGEVVRRPVALLGLGYRSSDLVGSDVVVGAEFRTEADDPAGCAARLDEIVRWRRANQPGGANAGSVFANPAGDSAGRLVEASGAKGLRVGGAVVSTKHANFIQAEAGATAADVAALVGEVRRRVAADSGVWLEPELRLVGFEGGWTRGPA